LTHDPKALQSALLSAAPELELGFRPMFGGIMAYSGGLPLASLSDVGLALKVAGADREALLAEPGARPLRYEPDQPESKSYVLVPDGMIGDPERLGGWARRAAAALKPKAKR
jgi:TfoX/Sxy family transcriptional regulator of competence genes